MDCGLWTNFAESKAQRTMGDSSSRAPESNGGSGSIESRGTKCFGAEQGRPGCNPVSVGGNIAGSKE